MKKPLTIIIIVFLTLKIFPILTAETDFNIIYVDDIPGEGQDNPPEDFTSIQDAINSSSDGDTIYVYNGTYKEIIVVYKSIDLIGENKTYTIIDAQRIDDAAWIVAPNVTITGFTITKSLVNNYTGGLHIRCKFVQISNCIIQDNDCGIRIQNTSNVTIENCTIFNNQASGIYCVSASDILIQHCKIFNNKDDHGLSVSGIRISISINDNSQSNITVQYCTIFNNQRSGIVITNNEINSIGYRNILIQNNYICNHSDRGIFVSECEVKILNNKIDKNGDGESREGGISLQDVNGIVIIKNNIISNSNKYGIYFLRSTNNVVENNDFYENGNQISFFYQDSIWSSNNFHDNYYDDLKNPWIKVFFGWYVNHEKVIIIPFMINIERNPSTIPNSM